MGATSEDGLDEFRLDRRQFSVARLTGPDDALEYWLSRPVDERPGVLLCGAGSSAWLFSLPRRLSSRRLDRGPIPQHVSARVPRRQPKRLRHEQLAQSRLKGDEKSGLAGSGPHGGATYSD
jgi:hypothetical protein